MSSVPDASPEKSQPAEQMDSWSSKPPPTGVFPKLITDQKSSSGLESGGQKGETNEASSVNSVFSVSSLISNDANNKRAETTIQPVTRSVVTSPNRPASFQNTNSQQPSPHGNSVQRILIPPISALKIPQQNIPKPMIETQPVMAFNSNPQQYIHQFPQNPIYPSPQIHPIYTQPYYQYPPMPMNLQPAPLPQPIVSRKTIPPPAIIIPKISSSDLHPPQPAFYRDPETGEYGIRCVCGQTTVDGILIQCESCEFWLHSQCVNVARMSKSVPYYCPYCLGKRIKCVCDKSNDYSIPLIQCTRCKMWVHKECEGLEFGMNPENFVCHTCDPNHREYSLPMVFFTSDDTQIRDEKIMINIDRSEFLENIPDGIFKDTLIEDLDKGEVSFRDVVPKYFHKFAPILFERTHEFWRFFCESLCAILNCERSELLYAIDLLATRLLYNQSSKYETLTDVTFEHSESITGFLDSHVMPRIEREPDNIQLFIDEDGGVHTPVSLDDGTYICDLPGFLMHIDEVKTDEGIPLTCLLVTDLDVVVDMNGSSFRFAPYIRRSFHFNTIVKLIRVNNEARVALYATRMKGPLTEEKTRRGPAILEGNEIILPFDGVIPFDTGKFEWKEKKQRYRSAIPKPKPKAIPPPMPAKKEKLNSKKKNKKFKEKEKEKDREREFRSKVDCGFKLTLLSSFFEDIVPPMPFIILEDQEAVDRYKLHMEVKSRARNNSRSRYHSEEE